MRVFNGNRDRVYHELSSGHEWRKQQVSTSACLVNALDSPSPKLEAKLRAGSIILSIILASDKMHLTNYSGDKLMHAVYMTLGNIHKDVQRKLTSHAWLLVAKIPVTKFLHTVFSGSKSEKMAMPGILRQ